MNFLLDTHIWLWSLLEPERLSRGVASALAARGARRWLSPLSVWEALLLIERGRLTVDRPGRRAGSARRSNARRSRKLR